MSSSDCDNSVAVSDGSAHSGEAVVKDPRARTKRKRSQSLGSGNKDAKRSRLNFKVNIEGTRRERFLALKTYFGCDANVDVLDTLMALAPDFDTDRKRPFRYFLIPAAFNVNINPYFNLDHRQRPPLSSLSSTETTPRSSSSMARRRPSPALIRAHRRNARQTRTVS